MNIKAKAKAQFIIAGIALVFSIFALFVINNNGLAWFSENDKATATGMNISVVDPKGLVASVEYFNISDITLIGEINSYHFDTTPDDDANLGVYSVLSSKRQLLIKVTLSDNVDAVTINAASSSSRYPVYDGAVMNTKNSPGLSSVVQLCVINSLNAVNGEYVVTDSGMASGMKRFATINSDGTLDSYSQDIPLYSTASGADDNVLFIFVDYYEDSIDYVLSYINYLIMGGDTDYQSGSEIPFNCDFTICFSTEE